MSFAIRSDAPADEELRRIAREQIEGALAQIADAAVDRDAVVHDSRRRVKRLRALVRLVRHRLPTAAAEDGAYRDAARGLASARDAASIVAAVERLQKHAEPREMKPVEALLRRLRERRSTESPASSVPAAALPAFAAAMEDALRRIDDWELPEAGFGLIEGGLGDVYRGARRRMQRAEERDDAESLHEWRKFVKHHWHHLELIGPVWPSVFAALADAAHVVADRLGDDHDLSLVADLLEAEPELAEGGASAVQRLVRRRRRRLQRQAFIYGGRLFAEPTRGFVRRVGAYWKLWRSE